MRAAPRSRTPIMLPAAMPPLIASLLRYRLPRRATAPFCPSEVRGAVAVPARAPWLTRFRAVAGAGLLVAVGYMDPGNWATDIAAGSRFGYALLWVVAASSLIGVFLQGVCARVGVATGRDLAQLCSGAYRTPTRLALWALAEIAIIACDVAEVVGTALALHLLVGVSLETGVLLTAFDTVVVLALQGAGFRRIEAIVGGLMATVAVCCGITVVLAHPDPVAVVGGLVPRASALSDHEARYLALGILGATVMPHNLYLHTSVVGTRSAGAAAERRGDLDRLARLDSALALGAAFTVNAALLVLAAATFHARGHSEVADIADAHRLLAPLLGTGVASALFAVALLACGQSSTLTGTIAGQVILEGFLHLKMPCWARRLITRSLAIAPAYVAVSLAGDAGIGRVLVATQVVLSLQLPFAIVPLLRFAGKRALMGDLTLPRWQLAIGWAVCALIVVASVAAL